MNGDYDAIQHLTLAELRINNRNRKVIMQANKNGYFYVIDRVNGEFHLRRRNVADQLVARYGFKGQGR